MPALPDVPKVIRADLRQEDQEDLKILNRLFFQYAGALSQVDSDTFCQLIATQWAGHILPVQHLRLTLDSVETTDLTTTSSPRSLKTSGAAGGEGGNGLNAGVAMSIDFLIARRYRGGKPKCFLAGMEANDLVDDELFDSTRAAAKQAAFAAFITAVTSGAPVAMGSVSHVNVSYFQGFHNIVRPSGRATAVPSLRVGGPVVDVITGYRADRRPSSQRRRNLQGA